jgi:hypothetical protein
MNFLTAYDEALAIGASYWVNVVKSFGGGRA